MRLTYYQDWEIFLRYATFKLRCAISGREGATFQKMVRYPVSCAPPIIFQHISPITIHPRCIGRDGEKYFRHGINFLINRSCFNLAIYLLPFLPKTNLLYFLEQDTIFNFRFVVIIEECCYRTEI